MDVVKLCGDSLVWYGGWNCGTYKQRSTGQLCASSNRATCALRFILWNVACLYGACYRWCVMVRMYGTRHRNYSALLCYGTLTPYVLANRARGNCLVWYIMVLMWWNCCMVTHSMCRATERGQRHRKFPGQVPSPSAARLAGLSTMNYGIYGVV